MKKILLAAAALAAVSYATSYAAKPERAPAPPASGEVEEVHGRLEVVKVNKTSQIVTFRNTKGEKLTVRVPPDVTDLDQVRPGTTLDVRYVKASAVAIGKTGAVTDAEENAVAAPTSDAGGAEPVRNRMVVGKVEKVDLVKRELKVKAPGDERITLKVSPGVSGLENLKTGDDAAIRFTEAVAVSVMPAGRGSADEPMPGQ